MFEINEENMSYELCREIVTYDRRPKGMCLVRFSDGVEKVNIRAALLQIPFWLIYKELHYPITKDKLFFRQGPYNPKLQGAILQRIYDDVLESRLTNTYDYIKEVREAFWKCINRCDDFGTMELNEEHCTLSIASLAKIVQHPKVHALLSQKLDMREGIVKMKQKWKEVNDSVIKLLTTKGALPENELYDYLVTNSLKLAQVGQVLYSYGLRTEINDKVIKRPVYGSSIEGLEDFADYAFEICAARKNTYYSLTGIRDSQYGGRKQAMASSAISRIYIKPCGTDVTLPWTFTESNITHCEGKIFIDPLTNKKVALTKYNMENYIDKTVEMYSPITCKHTDGICSECIGLLAKNYPPNINVGIVCATEFISNLSQRILSTKHTDQTAPEGYIIPYPTGQILQHSEDGIVFVGPITKELHKYTIGINLNDIYSAISDLFYINDELNVPEDKYSSIKSIYLRKGKETPVEFPLKVGNKIPFLTTQFLVHLRRHLKEVEIDQDKIWIPLVDYNPNTPILRSIVYNNSMLVFVDSVYNILEDKISKYHDASFALKDFTNLVFSKIPEMHIYPLETVLKAHLVTSSHNYSIPIVTNTKKVQFGQTKRINENRSISVQLAFEGHNAHFASPDTYTTAKDTGMFDQMVCNQVL